MCFSDIQDLILSFSLVCQLAVKDVLPRPSPGSLRVAQSRLSDDAGCASRDAHIGPAIRPQGDLSSRFKTVERDPTMQKPPLDPHVPDEAPTSPLLSVYDHQHLITYLRLPATPSDAAAWSEAPPIL